MRRSIFGVIALAAALLLAACSGDNAFQKQAYTLGKSYTLAQQGAITYMQVAKPSAAVTDKIAAADAKAAPMVKDVLLCAKSMLEPAPEPAPDAAALGLTGEEARAAECDSLLATALTALNDLRNAVKGD